MRRQAPERASVAGARRATIDRVSLAAIAAWSLLVAAQAGWLPGSRYAWGFGLWRYLPPAVSVALAGCALALCHHSARTTVIRLGGAIASAAARLPSVPRGIFLFALTSLALWIVRERSPSGDSPLLVLAVQAGERFVFPDTGATWLLARVCALGKSVGIPVWPTAQLWSCIWGGITAVLIAGASRWIAPCGAGLAGTLVLSGGLLRVFAGHIETYPVLLAAMVAYVWAGLACSEGRVHTLVCSLILGIAIWVHAAALCLVPSLIWLIWHGSANVQRSVRLRTLVANFGLVAAPMLLFFGGMLVSNDSAAIATAGAKALEILGRNPAPDAIRWWVRLPGGEPSIGTDVVLFSRAQLKYLLNAGYLLSPTMLPLLASALLRDPKRFVAAPEARFLTIAALPLVVYAFALRPFWGPYDWDLFSPTALVLAMLTVHLLAAQRGERAFHSTAVLLLGFTWLFVTVPLLATGIWNVRPAGPFAVSLQEYSLGRPLAAPPVWLAPWL